MMVSLPRPMATHGPTMIREVACLLPTAKKRKETRIEKRKESIGIITIAQKRRKRESARGHEITAATVAATEVVIVTGRKERKTRRRNTKRAAARTRRRKTKNLRSPPLESMGLSKCLICIVSNVPFQYGWKR